VPRYPETGLQTKKAAEAAFLYTFARSGRTLHGAVFLPEALDAASGIDNLLLACVERMAGGTDFDVQGLAAGGAGCEGVATTAGDVDFNVIRVNAGFHVGSFIALALDFGEPEKRKIILEINSLCNVLGCL
jgi:hypothetical protein